MHEAEVERLKTELREKSEEVDFLRNELSEVNFRLERLVEQSRHELKMINKIQKQLVPTEFPNIAGFEFSTKFVSSPVKGGDYFDLFDLSEKMKFGIVMSCASGYAMSALLMSILMKFSGHRLFGQTENVSEIVSGIYDELIETMGAGDSASLFFGMVDRRTHDVEFSVLGDIAAFHYEASTGEAHRIEQGLPALGQLAEEKISTHSVSLNPKDRLILCSSGFLEAENLSGERLSPDRLARSIRSMSGSSVHDMRNELLFQAEKHTSGGKVQRDRTVVVIEVKDRVIKLA